MRETHRLIPKKDRVLQGYINTYTQIVDGLMTKMCECRILSLVYISPVVELETRSPVGGTEQSLNSTGQVDKQVAHEEEPEQTHQ